MGATPGEKDSQRPHDCNGCQNHSRARVDGMQLPEPFRRGPGLRLWVLRGPLCVTYHHSAEEREHDASHKEHAANMACQAASAYGSSPSALVVNSTSGSIVRHAAAKSRMSPGAAHLCLGEPDRRHEVLPPDVLDDGSGRSLAAAASGCRPPAPASAWPSPIARARRLSPSGFSSGGCCQDATRRSVQRFGRGPSGRPGLLIRFLARFGLRPERLLEEVPNQPV